jgi:hypothetical protein
VMCFAFGLHPVFSGMCCVLQVLVQEVRLCRALSTLPFEAGQAAGDAARALRRMGQLLCSAVQDAGLRHEARARLDRPRVGGGVLGGRGQVAPCRPLRGRPRQAACVRGRVGEEAYVRDRRFQGRGARRQLEVLDRSRRHEEETHARARGLAHDLVAEAHRGVPEHIFGRAQKETHGAQVR